MLLSTQLGSHDLGLCTYGIMTPHAPTKIIIILHHHENLLLKKSSDTDTPLSVEHRCHQFYIYF